MTAPKIIIAVDGYSSCGKSTLAKQLAKKLGYIFIDSGAMYRGMSLYAKERGFVENGELNKEAIVASLPSVEMHFELNPVSKEPELYLNGVNVAQEIRSPEISSIVSKVSTIREVRVKLVDEQRKMGKKGGIVMDGRDIGSVVFPNAELKIFVTADLETRTNRRFQELLESKISTTREEVAKNLQERDFIDSTREISPLTQAHDAILLDNTYLTKEEQLDKVLALVEEKLVDC